MKKQKVRRLTLSRETLQQLDNPWLRELAGGELSTQCSFVCCPADTDSCPVA